MLLEFWNLCKERNPTHLSTWSLGPAPGTVLNLPQGLLSGLAVGHSLQGADVLSHLSLRPRSLAAVLPGNFFYCSDLLYGFLMETRAHQHQTITAPHPEKNPHSRQGWGGLGDWVGGGQGWRRGWGVRFVEPEAHTLLGPLQEKGHKIRDITLEIKVNIYLE